MISSKNVQRALEAVHLLELKMKASLTYLPNWPIFPEWHQ